MGKGWQMERGSPRHGKSGCHRRAKGWAGQGWQGHAKAWPGEGLGMAKVWPGYGKGRGRGCKRKSKGLTRSDKGMATGILFFPLAMSDVAKGMARGRKSLARAWQGDGKGKSTAMQSRSGRGGKRRSAAGQRATRHQSKDRLAGALTAALRRRVVIGRRHCSSVPLRSGKGAPAGSPGVSHALRPKAPEVYLGRSATHQLSGTAWGALRQPPRHM